MLKHNQQLETKVTNNIGESDPKKITRMLGKLDLGIEVNLEEVDSPKGGGGGGGESAKKNPF